MELVAGWLLFTRYQIFLDFLLIDFHLFFLLLVLASLLIPWLVYLVAYLTSSLGYCLGYFNFKWPKMTSWVPSTASQYVPLPVLLISINGTTIHLVAQAIHLCVVYICVVVFWSMSYSLGDYLTFFCTVTTVPLRVSST